MIAAIDVHYCNTKASVGCVVFKSWPDSAPWSEHTMVMTNPSPYVAGEFYKRELPCIVGMLRKLDQQFDTIVIDGYVWLASERPGLGQKLFEALGNSTPIVGVAKRMFANNDVAHCVRRANSKLPLYVTASGVETHTAAEHIKGMYGAYRVPTLLKRADTLCRQANIA